MRDYQHQLGTIHYLEPGDDPAPVWELVNSGGPLAWDTETTGTNPYAADFETRLFQIGSKDLVYVLPVAPHKELVRALVTSGRTLYAHNRVFDFLALERGAEADFWAMAEHTRDTGILSRLLDPRDPSKGGHGHKLDQLMRQYLKLDDKGEARKDLLAAGRKLGLKQADVWAKIPLDTPEYIVYAGGDVMGTARLAPVLESLVSKDERDVNLALYEHRLDVRLAQITRNGIRLDVPFTEALQDRYRADLEAAERALEERGVGGSGRWRHKARASLIEAFKARGVTDWPKRSEKTGAESLDAEVLAIFAKHPSPEVRELAELVAAAQKARHYGEDYCGGFLEAVGYDGRVHPLINPMAAATGRMSISNPPLQQIPKDDKDVRGCYLADEGHVFVGADYAQVEFRVAAAISGDKRMKRAIAEGEDLHANVALQLYGEEWLERYKAGDPEAKAQRDVAKRAGFGRLYGAGAPTVAKQTGVPVRVAEKVIRAFDETYPGIKAFDNRMRSRVDAGQYAMRTVTGRRVITDRAHAMTNYQIQSPARDIMAQGVMNLFDAGLGDALRLVVHDEVQLSVPRADAEDVCREVVRCLETQLLGVKIETDAKVAGERWAKI